MPSDEVVHLETFVPLAPCYLTSVQAYRRPFVWRTRHQRWCPSSCNNCCLGWIKVRWRIRIIIIFISPTGAVAKYCNEYVCVCVCVSVREDISGTTRAIFTIFSACCLWPWLGPHPAPLRYVMYFRFSGWHQIFMY